jgi:hypothetical protein
MSKEPPSRAHALADHPEAVGVLAHVPESSSDAPTLPGATYPDRMLANDMGSPLLDAILSDAEQDLRSLVVIDKEQVTWLLIDAPAAEDEGIVAEAVAEMEGVVARGDGTGALARFASPAAAVGTWLALAAWTGTEVRGAAVSGYCHRAELVGATLAELPDLLAPAGAGELWVSFEIATSVDLNDERFSVERIERGSLVPASCRLTLR